MAPLLSYPVTVAGLCCPTTPHPSEHHPITERSNWRMYPGSPEIPVGSDGIGITQMDGCRPRAVVEISTTSTNHKDANYKGGHLPESRSLCPPGRAVGFFCRWEEPSVPRVLQNWGDDLVLTFMELVFPGFVNTVRKTPHCPEGGPLTPLPSLKRKGACKGRVCHQKARERR